jgi:hypothetical protein
MKHLKVLGVAFVALFAFGITTATTAFALPDISITLGGAYPLHLEVTLLTLATKLSSGTGKSLTGEGFLLLYLTKELTALGTFEALFLKVENAKKTKCNSVADKAGEVLTRGTFHVVYTSLNGSTQGLQLGVLYLVQPFEIECGTEEFPLVRGSLLSSINSSGTGTGSTSNELTTLSGASPGNGAGVPTIKFYDNESGVAQLAKLETNFGTGFVTTAEEITETTVTALEGKMFVISSR